MGKRDLAWGGVGFPLFPHEYDAIAKHLAKLEVRITRRKKAIADLTHERQTIMNRCIRRMRRAEGKQ